MKRSAWRFLFLSTEIRNRLLISIGLLVIYRLAAHVPVPGVAFQFLPWAFTRTSPRKLFSSS